MNMEMEACSHFICIAGPCKCPLWCSCQRKDGPCDRRIPTLEMGYHKAEITQGVYGEISKIQEELEEFYDALAQQCKVMELVELSDLVGAIRGYLNKYHPSISLEDLIKMADITGRAFENGHR